MTSTPSLFRRARGRLARTTPAGSPAVAPIPADGIAGRWIRVTAGPGHVEPSTDRQGTDPTEAAAVRAGWLLLDAHERLSKRGADRVFGHETEAWHAYAAETMGELTYTLSDGKELVPETRKNRLRFRRTLDFARHGEVVFDVGFGRGLLAAQLIKDRGVQSYHGIDVVDRYVPIATDLFHVNGLSPESLNLEVGDLYDLTRERIAATGATLVICCEVLEHVPDAELALKTLADSLPEGADLLFSVPMHGRIESEWGHVSVFDVARLKTMLEGAGLFAHHVEPLANAWSLIVASREPGPSRRVREATGRSASNVSVPLSRHRDFVYVDPSVMSAAGPATLKVHPTLVTCTTGSGGGASFPVTSLEALRLRFRFADPSHVTQIVATAYAADETVARWTWKVKPGQLVGGVTTTTAMRPGETGVTFVGGRHDEPHRADRIDVTCTVAGGVDATFNLKAAYLP